MFSPDEFQLDDGAILTGLAANLARLARNPEAFHDRKVIADVIDDIIAQSPVCD